VKAVYQTIWSITKLPRIIFIQDFPNCRCPNTDDRFAHVEVRVPGKRSGDKFETPGKGLLKGGSSIDSPDRLPILNTLWLLCCEMVFRAKTVDALDACICGTIIISVVEHGSCGDVSEGWRWTILFRACDIWSYWDKFHEVLPEGNSLLTLVR